MKRWTRSLTLTRAGPRRQAPKSQAIRRWWMQSQGDNLHPFDHGRFCDLYSDCRQPRLRRSSKLDRFLGHP